MLIPNKESQFTMLIKVYFKKGALHYTIRERDPSSGFGIVSMCLWEIT